MEHKLPYMGDIPVPGTISIYFNPEDVFNTGTVVVVSFSLSLLLLLLLSMAFAMVGKIVVVATPATLTLLALPSTCSERNIISLRVFNRLNAVASLSSLSLSSKIEDRSCWCCREGMNT